MDLNEIGESIYKHLSGIFKYKIELHQNPISVLAPSIEQLDELVIGVTEQISSRQIPIQVRIESAYEAITDSLSGVTPDETARSAYLSVWFGFTEKLSSVIHPEVLERTDQFRSLLASTDQLGGVARLDISVAALRLVVNLPVATDDEIPKGGFVGGSETILLVEDEEFVREVTREALELSRYRVLSAKDAFEGIELFERFGGKVDLLLTDIVMPGMNGHVLSQALQKRAPHLKTIYMSGYTDNAIVRQGISLENAIYLQKPFTLEFLAEKVREVIDLELSDEAQRVPSTDE